MVIPEVLRDPQEEDEEDEDNNNMDDKDDNSSSTPNDDDSEYTRSEKSQQSSKSENSPPPPVRQPNHGSIGSNSRGKLAFPDCSLVRYIPGQDDKEKAVTDDHAATADSEGNLEPSVPSGLENPTEDPTAFGEAVALGAGAPAKEVVAAVPGGSSGISHPSATTESLKEAGHTSDLQSGELGKAVGDNREADPEADDEPKKRKSDPTPGISGEETDSQEPTQKKQKPDAGIVAANRVAATKGKKRSASTSPARSLTPSRTSARIQIRKNKDANKDRDK